MLDVSKLYKLNIIPLVGLHSNQIMFDVWRTSQMTFGVWCLELKFNILQPSLIIFKVTIAAQMVFILRVIIQSTYAYIYY